MADLAEVLFRPIAVGILWVLRAMLWLGWELMFSTIGWGAGWLVVRIATVGRLPNVGIREEGNYDFLPRLAVELIGLLALSALVWWLAGALEA
ncbi:MAG: hypothetical protein H6933_02605 [Burkholderiaceae bacterium]|nr:hypothetical protein [Burkholderiaceae bacterium]